MKSAIVLCVLFAGIWAKPDGYFKQHYEYKSSSSSYKDNELQQKKDDEGFYSRHGDLEGRTEPKVNSYSQHSEYVNPKLQNGQGHNQALQNNDFYLQQTGGGQGGYNTNQGYGSNYNTGTAGHTSGSDMGTKGYGSGSSYSRGSSYSSGSTFQQQAAINDQVRSLKDLQDTLTRQLQQALHDQQKHTSASHSQVTSTNTGTYGSNTNYQYLEDQLRNNVTHQFNDAIRQQYQGRISNDQYNQYHQQLQNDLLHQLQSGTPTYNSQTSQSSYNNQYSNSYVRPTTGESQTVHLTPGSQTTNSFDSTRYGTNTQTYRIPHPIPLSDVTTRLEVDIQNIINKAVRNRIHTYTQKYGYQSQPDYYTELQRLTDELQANITRQLDSELIRNYGRQEQRGSHYYTITTAGPNSTPNYRVDELERVRQELYNKLSRELQTQFQQQYAQYTQSVNQYNRQTLVNSGQNTNYYGSSHIGTSPTIKTQPQPPYPYQPHHTTFVVTGSAPAELRRATETIHFDVFRDLQNALTEQQSRYLRQHSGQSAQVTYNPQEYQMILQQLTNELRHNITKQIEKQLAIQYGHQTQKGSNYYSVISGGGYSAAPNYNSQQLNDVTQQLQNDLVQQLQASLSKQYSSHSSYSASSSFSGQSAYSTNAQQGIKTHSNYGYMSDGESMQGDDSFYRSSNGYYPDRQNQYDKHMDQSLTQQSENQFGQMQIGRYNGIDKERYDNDQTRYSPSYYRNTFTQQPQNSYNSKLSNYDMSQQTEDDYGQSQIANHHKNQDYQVQTSHALPLEIPRLHTLRHSNVYDQKLTQQTEDETPQLQIGAQQKLDYPQKNQKQTELGQLQIGQKPTNAYEQTEDQFGELQIGRYQKPHKQNMYDQDMTQQTEDEFGQLQIGGSYNKNKYDQDMTQQTEDEFGQLQIGGNQNPHKKSMYDQDMTQQTRDEFGQLQIGGHHKQNKYNQDMTQQTEDEFGQLQIGGEQNPKKKSMYDQDVTQQTEDEFGQLQIGGRHKQNKYDQDMTQQTADEFGQLQIGSDQNLHKKSMYDKDITQQTEDEFGQLQIGGSQKQNKYDQDMTQQTEDEFGQLQIAGHQKPRKPNTHHHDMTQQTEDAFGTLQVGQQKVAEIAQHHSQDQQSQHFGQLEIVEPETQHGEDMTQQTEDDFGHLPIGTPHKIIDMTQHQESYNQKTNGGDMAQQSEEYGQMIVGQHFEHPQRGYGDPITQHTHTGKQTVLDMPQESEEGFGQLQVGQQKMLPSHNSYNPKSYEQREDVLGQLQIGQQKVNDMTQQKQEYDQLNEELSQLQIGRPGKVVDAQQKQGSYNKQTYGEDMTQQTENDFGQSYKQDQQQEEVGQLQIGQQNRKQFDQKIYGDDLTQQTEDEFGQLQIGQQKSEDFTQQNQNPYNQRIYGHGIVQQTEDEFGQLQIGQQNQKANTQKMYGHDLTQQTEDEFGQLQIGQQKSIDFTQQNQKMYGQHMTQHTKDAFGQLQIGQQKSSELTQPQKPYNKVIYDEDMTQQTEDEFGQLQIGQQKLQTPSGQRVGHQDLTQQIEDDFGYTQPGKKNIDVTTQTEQVQVGRQRITSQLPSQKQEDLRQVNEANDRLIQMLTEKLNKQREEPEQHNYRRQFLDQRVQNSDFTQTPRYTLDRGQTIEYPIEPDTYSRNTYHSSSYTAGHRSSSRSSSSYNHS